jgi:hypothetical protein
VRLRVHLGVRDMHRSAKEQEARAGGCRSKGQESKRGHYTFH